MLNIIMYIYNKEIQYIMYKMCVKLYVIFYEYVNQSSSNILN